MINNTINNSLDKKVFDDDLDFKTLENLLETLDHVVVKKVSRQEFNDLKWDFLVEKWENKYWKYYELFLPEDLFYGELLFFIDFLSNKFNLQDYLEFEKIFSQVKIMVWIILRWWWDNDNLKQLQKKYNLSDEFVWKILSQKLLNSNSKEFIKSIISKWKLNFEKGYIWESEDDIEIWINELKDLFWNEFDLTFFKKWINMLRFWMMTITQVEQERLMQENEWNENFITHVDIKYLDEQERLLREKLAIDDLKQELKIVRKSWNQELINDLELKFSNKIYTVLRNYPYVHNEKDYWYQINKILEYKEIYCVWFSLLWHTFLKELWIKHNWLDLQKHSALELIIWWKKYFFDPTSTSDKLLEFDYWKKIWAYNEINLESIWIVKLLIQPWITEKILLSKVYNNKWNSLTNLWKLQESIRMFNKAVKLCPSISDNYTSKWNSLTKLWEYEEAIKMYDIAKKLNPKFFLIYNNKWNALYYLWKFKESIQMYDKAILLSPYVFYIYRNKWNALQKLWEWKESIEMYNMSILFELNNFSAYKSKWISLIKLWKIKIWNLNLFTAKLLEWKNIYLEWKYKEEKIQIIDFVKNEDYYWLNQYLNNL